MSNPRAKAPRRRLCCVLLDRYARDRRLGDHPDGGEFL